MHTQHLIITMSKSHFLFIVAFLIASLLWAQTCAVTGTITYNNELLPFATIYIPELEKGTTADGNGTYTVTDVPYGNYTLAVSSLGYKSQKKQITLAAENSCTHNFNMIEDQSSLDAIVISGTLRPVSKQNSPIPVEVYSQAFFRKNPNPSIFESLQNINGVRPQLNCNVCNTGDIHINGLEGPYTFVLIDGMPIVSGLSTVYGLTGIPQSLIERVEIVKGPASTLYGSEAVGGIINIITKKPGNAPRTSVESFGTSWGEVNTDIGISYKAGKKGAGLLGVNYFNYQNPIDTNGDGFTDLTLQNCISIFNKFNVERASGKLFSLAGRYLYEDRWGGDMNWNSHFRGGDEIYGESIFTSRWETFGTYQLPTEENVTFQFSANGHDQNSVYGTDVYIASQYIGFGQLTWNKRVGKKHDLLMGAAYRYTYYDDNTFATAQTDGVTNLPSIMHLPGIFIQDEIALAPQHNLLVGMRYDYNSLHGSIASPRINYKWNSENNKDVIRLSAGNGFRVANVFTEDHAALTGAREVVFEGELRPETSWNANLNYVKNIVTSDNVFINLDASAFYTYFTNRILPDYDTDPNKIIYANLDGNSISQGISLNVDIAWQNGLSILAGATFMDVSITEQGLRSRQPLTESFSGVWTATYAFKKIGLSIDYTGNLYGPMDLPLLGDLDPRAPQSPWFSIQNIQVTKKLGRTWELYGGVKNLLNFTPPANSIARAFDPFDNDVTFDPNGQAVATPGNPNALTFDPTYMFSSNQGIRGFLGLRYTIF